MGRPAMQTLYKGKVNKSAMLVPLMLEEYRRAGKIDFKRMMLIAQKRLESFPEKQTAGIVINRKNLDDAAERARNILAAEKGSGKVVAVVVSKETSTFTKQDLCFARDFLQQCGSSLVKARELLDLISTLTGGKG